MASSRSLGTLTLDLIARVGGFSQGMDQAARAADTRARQIDRTFAKLRNSLLGVFSVAGGIAVVKSIVSNAIALGDELDKIRVKSDITGRAASELAHAFHMADLSTEDLTKSLKTQKQFLSEAATGGKEQLKTLRALGLEYSNLKGLAVDQQFELIAERISQLKDVQDKTRASTDIFGKSGESLLPMFERGAAGIKAAREEAVLLGKSLSDEQIDALAAADDSIKRLTSSWEGFATSLVAKVAPGLTKVLDALNKIQQVKGPSLEKSLLQAGLTNPILGIGGLILGAGRKPIGSSPTPGGRGAVQGSSAGANAAVGFAAADAASKAGEATRKAMEDLQKMEADLKKQIALFGLTGEAAKLAYDIAHGAFAGAGKAKQQELIQYARELDALQATADAKKEAAEAATKAAAEQVAAQESLQKAFESQEDALLRQLVLTAEATELEQLRYEINSGGLQKLTDGQKEWLKLLAADVDAVQARVEAEKDFQDLLEEGRSIAESLRTPLEVYQDSIRELNHLVDAGAISWNTYGRAVAVAQDELDDATNTFHFMEEAARGTQDILADGLFGAMQGEIDNIGKSFLKMLNQLVAQALAADLTKKLFGEGGKGGLLDKGLNLLSGFFGGGKAGGGAVSSGTMYRVNETGVESLRIPGRQDYLMTGSYAGEVIPANRTGSSRGGNTTQNIVVQGMPTQRTARQMAIEESRRQRIATARLA